MKSLTIYHLVEKNDDGLVNGELIERGNLALVVSFSY